MCSKKRGHNETIDRTVGKEGRDEFGLTMTEVGKHWIIDATSIDFPLWLSVSNEDQFHSWSKG